MITVKLIMALEASTTPLLAELITGAHVNGNPKQQWLPADSQKRNQHGGQERKKRTVRHARAVCMTARYLNLK